MAKRKRTRKFITYTRKELVEKMNVIRRSVDTVILNLIYNPNSNDVTLGGIRKLKKELGTLPDIYAEGDLFNQGKATEAPKPKGDDA